MRKQSRTACPREALAAALLLAGCASSYAERVADCAKAEPVPFTAKVATQTELRKFFEAALSKGRVFTGLVPAEKDADVRVDLALSQAEEPQWDGLPASTAIANFLVWGVGGIASWWVPSGRWEREATLQIKVVQGDETLTSYVFLSTPQDLTFRDSYSFLGSPGPYLLSLVLPPCLFPVLGFDPERPRVAARLSRTFLEERTLEAIRQLKEDLSPQGLAQRGETAVALAKVQKKGDKNVAFFRVWLPAGQSLLRFTVKVNGRLCPECDPTSKSYLTTHDRLRQMSEKWRQGEAIPFTLPAVKRGQNRITVETEDYGRKVRRFTFVLPVPAPQEPRSRTNLTASTIRGAP